MQKKEKDTIFSPTDYIFYIFLFISLYYCIKTPQEPRQLQNLETLKAASQEGLPAWGEFPKGIKATVCVGEDNNRKNVSQSGKDNPLSPNTISFLWRKHRKGHLEDFRHLGAASPLLHAGIEKEI